MELRRYVLHIKDEGDGMLWAEVEGLPGCFASGSDMDELLEATAEAIGMYLSDGDRVAQVDVMVPPPKDCPTEAVDNVRPARAAGTPHYAVEKAEILVEA